MCFAMVTTSSKYSSKYIVCVVLCKINVIQFRWLSKKKKENWKGITFALNCTNFQKNSLKETQDICGHFYACDVILSPEYQLISRQIGNQLARGHKKTKKFLLKYYTVIFNFFYEYSFCVFVCYTSFCIMLY